MRGGRRLGAGRKPGQRNSATLMNSMSIGELARQNTETALKTLVDVAMHGKSESARVSAASALLDRGYGRPMQALEVAGRDGGPIEHRKADGMTREEVIAGLEKNGLPTNLFEE